MAKLSGNDQKVNGRMQKPPDADPAVLMRVEKAVKAAKAMATPKTGGRKDKTMVTTAPPPTDAQVDSSAKELRQSIRRALQSQLMYTGAHLT